MTWGLLLLSLLVLAAGPAVSWLASRSARLLPVVDGFILGSLGSLVFFALLPEAVQAAGSWAIVAAGAGLLLLTAMERVGHIEPERTHGLALVLAVIGLLAHTVLDGMAVHGGGHANSALAWAVIVHRLPVAVALWWLVRPKYGQKAGALVLLGLAVTTLIGFALGGRTLSALDSEGAALFSAFVGGALIHVLFHRVAHPDKSKSGLHVAETIGLLVGLVFMWSLPHSEAPTHTEHAATHDQVGYGARLLDLALESAPAVLLGFLMAGLVVVALPEGTVAWLLRGNRGVQAAKGTVFGIPIPICSCGVVPLYQGLVRRGAPPAAGFAFLIATPELGIESLFLSVPLLGGELTLARLVCALIAAFVVGFLVSGLVGRGPKAPPPDVGDEDRPEGVVAKGLAALRYGLHDVVGDVAAWILAGVAVAAAVDAGSLEAVRSSLPWGADVALAALVGMPLYVCASGATPLAAGLLLAGLSPGAAVAFLLAGPATNVTTFGVLTQLHGRRVAFSFGAATAVSAVLLGLGTNLLLGDNASGWASGLEHDHGHGWVAWSCLVVLSAAFAWAVVRKGPTAFFRPVLTFGDHHHSHDDDHSHGHGHDHDGHDHDGHDHGGHDHGGHDHGGHDGHDGHGPSNPTGDSCCHGS